MMQEQHQSHVLELVLPYLDTREMHCRASLVSQHISGCMRAHIRQHIAAFLEQYLSCRGWLQDKPKPKGVSTSSSAEHPRFSSVRWLCGCAGAEAMGSAAAAGAVLSAGVSLYSRKDVTRELVQSGLRLTDDVVVAAAQQQCEYAADVVGWLLQSTPPELAHQHSGLSPLMRFVCTAKHSETASEEVLAGAAAMSAEQITGVLHVQANHRVRHPELFRQLLQTLLNGMPPSANRSREARELLLSLLRTLLIRHRGGNHDACAQGLVEALGDLPPAEQPDCVTCCQLLRLAVDSCPDAIPHLAARALPGVQSLPQEVFAGLLCTQTNMDARMGSLRGLLQLPHAQHVTSSQLCQLLMNCMDTDLITFAIPVGELLRLPAAEALTSDQALQLLKAATAHDGPLLAGQSSYGRIADDKLVFDAFADLTGRLTQAAAVELFRHVIHYRWRELVPHLVSCMLLVQQLGPDRMAAVVRDLVTSGLWINIDNASHDEQQLQDKLLELDTMQFMSADAAYAVMRALAESGHSFTRVFCKVDAVRDMDRDQVAALLQLAMDNGESTDICNLARCCSAAASLDTAFVLQLVRQLVDTWPVPAHIVRYVLWQHATCVHLHNRPEALVALLRLPAAKDFSEQDCLALATQAARAGSLDAFMGLCNGLPQLRAASRALPVALLLRMYRQAVDAGDDKAVRQLASLQASQQLSSTHLQPLLLQAFAKATRVRSSWDKESIWSADGMRELKAADVLLQRDRVIEKLLNMQASDALTPDSLTELLQSCVAHGLQEAAEALLELPAAQQLGPDQLEQLLCTCLTQATKQVKDGQEAQQGMLGLLLQQPSAARLDADAVGRLLMARGAFVAAGCRGRKDGMYGRQAADSVESDPVEVLVEQLPALQQCDAAGLVSLLAAAVQGAVSSRVFEALCKVPAAARLDSAQLRQLLRVCAQHSNAGAFELLLQHPAAPGSDDSRVAMYAAMLRKA